VISKYYVPTQIIWDIGEKCVREFVQHHPVVLVNHQQIPSAQTQQTNSTCSLFFIFFYMFRSYILAIIRYKNAGVCE